MNPFCQKVLLGVGRSPLFAQQPSRRSWLSRGWLTCVDGGIDEHGGSRALPCVRASDQVCRAGFQRAVYVCRWWDGQAWRISLTCYFPSGRCRFANHATLRHRFHVVTAHHCAVLLNKDTFERDFTTNSIMVHAKKKSAECASEGVVVNGRFRRPAEGACHYFSILNVHVNYMCAARRSICCNLLLLIRSWCAQEGDTSLAGEFNEDAQRGKFGEPCPLQATCSPVPCRDVRCATLSGPGTRSVPNAVTLSTAAHQSRVTHEEDGSHGCGCQEYGPILSLWQVTTPAARSLQGDQMRPTSSEKQPWGAVKIPTQRWVVMCLYFFSCLSAVC